IGLKLVRLKKKGSTKTQDYYISRFRKHVVPVLDVVRSFGIKSATKVLNGKKSFEAQGDVMFDHLATDLLKSCDLFNLQAVQTVEDLVENATAEMPPDELPEGEMGEKGGSDSDAAPGAPEGSGLGLTVPGSNRKSDAASGMARQGAVESRVESLVDENVFIGAAPPKGAADYWIWKSPLGAIAENTIAIGSQEKQIDILLPKLDDNDRNRLKTHKLHMHRAKQFREGNVQSSSAMELKVEADKLQKAGIQWMKMTLIRLCVAHADVDLTDFTNHDLPVAQRTASLQKALQRLQLHRGPEEIGDFQITDPLMRRLPISDAAAASTFQATFFKGHLCSWTGQGEAGAQNIVLFRDAFNLVNAIGNLQDAFKDETMDDVVELDLASERSACSPTLWELVGHAIKSSVDWSRKLEDVKANVENLKKVAPIVAAASTAMSAMGSPTVEAAEQLYGRAKDLPDIHAKAKGAADSFEITLKTKATTLISKLVDGLPEFSKQLIECCIDVSSITPLQKKLDTVLTAFQSHRHQAGVSENMKSYTLGDENDAKELSKLLISFDVSKLDKVGREAALALFMRIIAQAPCTDFKVKDIEFEMELLRAMVSAVPAARTKDCSIVSQIISCASKSLAIVGLLGEQLQSIAEDASVPDESAVVQRLVELDRELLLSNPLINKAVDDDMSALFDKAKFALKDARAQRQQVSQRLCHGALAVYADAQDKLINSVDKESSWQEFVAAANDGGKSWEDVRRVAGDAISKW
ncbi:unnamed protein product, partial [Prorocentrum cordatum]